jgi:tRNA pseudouridine55 synthase
MSKNQSGLLLVDKPMGLSSAAVVAKVKHHFKFDKVGHGGTLDPFATGLLVLLIGEGTKVARFLLEGEKTYLATARIGFETDTADPTGQQTEASVVVPTLDAWEQTRAQFVGNIMQKPPVYSAIKRDGKALYARARAGEVIETEARPVFVRSLELQEYAPPLLKFLVECGGGTYIRSLAVDWARAAGSMTHLAELRRISTLGFSIKNAYTLTDILARQEAPLLSLEQALAHLSPITCSALEAVRVAQGNLSSLSLPTDAKPGFYALRESERLVAILSRQENWQIERVFL